MRLVRVREGRAGSFSVIAECVRYLKADGSGMMDLKLTKVALAVVLLTCVAGWSQQPSAAPAATPAASQPAPRPNLIAMIALDHFAAEDSRLRANGSAPVSAVLMGDSITEAWKRSDPSLFAGDHYLGRGISGQTTPQMLLRFRQDVIDHHPGVVAILAGTNDLAQNTGPETVDMIVGNIESMADLAQAHHVAVVLCSITPTDHYPWKPGILPANDIRTINSALRQYALDHHMIYADYFSALAGPDGTMAKALSLDGVHPTAAGYAIMRPLLEKSVAEALRQRP